MGIQYGVLQYPDPVVQIATVAVAVKNDHVVVDIVLYDESHHFQIDIVHTIPADRGDIPIPSDHWLNTGILPEKQYIHGDANPPAVLLVLRLEMVDGINHLHHVALEPEDAIGS